MRASRMPRVACFTTGAGGEGNARRARPAPRSIARATANGAAISLTLWQRARPIWQHARARSRGAPADAAARVRGDKRLRAHSGARDARDAGHERCEPSARPAAVPPGVVRPVLPEPSGPVRERPPGMFDIGVRRSPLAREVGMTLRTREPILLCGPTAGHTNAVAEWLGDEGWNVERCPGCEALFAFVSERRPAALVYALAHQLAVDQALLALLRRVAPDLPVVVVAPRGREPEAARDDVRTVVLDETPADRFRLRDALRAALRGPRRRAPKLVPATG
jgi:hypothetical protein